MMPEKTMLLDVLFAAVGYFIGAINFSLIAARLARKPDPRHCGSGNAGATNLLRTAGWRVALPVLLLDVLRGFAFVWAASLLPLSPYGLLGALAVLLGNLFPIYHGFRGGKGVATSAGIALGLSPLAFGAALLLALLVLALSRRVSLLSLSLLFFFAAILGVRDGCGLPLGLATAMCAVVFGTHRANLKRLFSGDEPRLF